jgi:hypothetical protein
MQATVFASVARYSSVQIQITYLNLANKYLDRIDHDFSLCMLKEKDLQRLQPIKLTSDVKNEGVEGGWGFGKWHS